MAAPGMVPPLIHILTNLGFWPNCKRITVEVEPGFSVMDLKVKIEEKEGIHPARQMLVIGREELQDNVKLNLIWASTVMRHGHGNVHLRIKEGVNIQERSILHYGNTVEEEENSSSRPPTSPGVGDI